MINVNECLALLSAIPVLDKTETVALNASLGRVLAYDIVADTDLPPFDKSAMDDYACQRNDLPGPLQVRGHLAAGAFTEDYPGPGECFRIFTGAPVPKGADCVIVQEYTEQDSNGNVVFTQSDTKSNICYQGEDMKAGEVAIKSGTVIQPQHMAIMAGFGVTHPKVAIRPRVVSVQGPNW
jgi:molybdopterin molybdotransferase